MSRSVFVHVIFALATIIPASSRIAHAAEPFISVEWQQRYMGTVSAGQSFSWTETVSMFGRGTIVSTSTDRATTVVSPASSHIDALKTFVFTISGVTPTTAGPFTMTVQFTYSNSSGSVSTPVTITGTVTTPSDPGPSYVGVIPQTVSQPPSAADCPPGASLVYFLLDNEDSNNQNGRAGWIGSIVSGHNTGFYYCRIDGRLFKPLSTASTTSNHYAVVKLSPTCPAGSTTFSRYWDNDNGAGDVNIRWTSSGNSADFGNNTITGNDFIMHFCLFRAGTETMAEFPNLGIHYGVFAAPGFTKAVASGWVATDDEDASNNNAHSGDADAQRIIAPTGSGGRNTTVYTARVTPETSPVARCELSPSRGFDAVAGTFVGTGSFARAGRVLTGYAWTISSGGAVFGPGPHSWVFGLGRHLVQLTVTDSAGASATAVCEIMVGSSSPGECIPGVNCDDPQHD